MQIGNSVYLNIKVKGSLNFDDFITPQNLKNFMLVETAGTSLPYVCFSFFSTDKKIIEYFIENNSKDIEVSIGNTIEDSDKFNVQLITTPKGTDGSDATATITAGGFIGSKPFMVDKGECRAFLGNSLMVVKKVIQRYEGLDSEIDTDFVKLNENQVVHRQLYETASNFLVKTILHMNTQPSFPLFTFDKYGKFHLKDFSKVVEAGAKFKFTPFPPTESTEIQYLNNFNVASYKAIYNLYSGYNKITEIYGVDTGLSSYNIALNDPLIASTKESEMALAGNRISLNKIQSKNVHNSYMEAYAYNTNNLVSLSSMQGVLLLAGYHPELKPTDLVYVQTPKENGMISSLEGNYLIDTVVLTYDFGDNVPKTYVCVTRDNNNNIENFVVNKNNQNKIKVSGITLRDLANAISRVRAIMASCSQVIDGSFIEKMQSYLISTRNNLLRSFSVDGIRMDFTSQARMLQSALIFGNSLMNIFTEMIFPKNVSFILRDFLISETSLRGLVGKYIYEYVPYEIQGLISDLVDSMCSVHSSLNTIAKDNGVTIREVPSMTQSVNITSMEDDNKVGKIIEQFENNTTGLDIPFPIIELTESQKLLSENDLEDFVANETIAKLTDAGYLENLSEDEIEEFKNILLGKVEINFVLINKINTSAGNSFNYRFWGTFGFSNEVLYAWKYEDDIIYTKTEKTSEYSRLYNEDYSPYAGYKFKIIGNPSEGYQVMYTKDGETYEAAERDENRDINSNALVQLTDYYIKKGFKDKYRTIPCTKLISAIKNARLYFACPQEEKNIRFYINSRRVELESFPIDLGYTDVYGNSILYNVYYTSVGYNSNSVMLEVRQ